MYAQLQEPTTMNKNFIGIAGLIGVGKSTLTEKLAEALGYKAFFEPVSSNPYLAEFYKEPEKFSFEMQIYFLSERFRQHQELIWAEGGGVQDRTIYEDSVFAKSLLEKGLLSPRSYETYTKLFSIMSNFLAIPTIIIFLKAHPEVCLERIRRRSRSQEVGISLEYLETLEKHYGELMEKLGKLTTVIELDWTEFQDTQDVVRLCEPHLNNR